MNRRHVQGFVLAALLGLTPVALAGGGSHAADSSDQDVQAKPAGAETLPRATPPASSQPSGIGNISDVPGSMSDGAPTAASRQAPAGAEQLPPVLPPDTKQDGRIGNMEDATGSMSDGSTSKQ